MLLKSALEADLEARLPARSSLALVPEFWKLKSAFKKMLGIFML